MSTGELATSSRKVLRWIDRGSNQRGKPERIVRRRFGVGVVRQPLRHYPLYARDLGIVLQQPFAQGAGLAMLGMRRQPTHGTRTTSSLASLALKSVCHTIAASSFGAPEGEGLGWSCSHQTPRRGVTPAWGM